MTSFSVDTSSKSQPPVTRTAENTTGANAQPANGQQVANASEDASAIDASKPASQSIEQVIAQTQKLQEPDTAGTSIDGWLGVAEEGAGASGEAGPGSAGKAMIAARGQGADVAKGGASDPGIDPIETASLLPHVDPGGTGGSATGKQKRIPGVMPLSERQCRSQLSDMGVKFSEVSAIANGKHCGIDYPVEVQSLSGDVKVSPEVVVNCQTALSFAQWVQNEVAPAVRVRYLTGLDSVQTMGGYSCRRMNNGKRNTDWSEHATGNAIDVGGFRLNNGREIDVSPKGLFAFRERGLLKSIRASSCGYFSTVLGPGYPKHDDHFHFDLKQRSSGRAYCS
ncbi:extensin-like domain-containing protein [Martelella mediterranea]|nr:extensin family protein [Martelella mediterranea]